MGVTGTKEIKATAPRYSVKTYRLRPQKRNLKEYAVRKEDLQTLGVLRG